MGEDDQVARIRVQLADLLDAVRDGHEPAVSAESGADPIKVLNGIHWHGWRHGERFRDFLRGLDDLGPAPATVESARAAGWQGGRIVGTLLDVVRSPDPRLEAPFLS